MARRKTGLERSNCETRHVWRWLLGSTEVDQAALSEQARQEYIADLANIIRGLVNKHVGEFDKNDRYRNFEEEFFNDNWDHEVDSLMGGLATFAFDNVDFGLLALLISERSKHQAEGQGT